MYQYVTVMLVIALVFFMIGYKTRFRDANAVKVVQLDKVKEEDKFTFLRRVSHTMNAIGLALSLSAIIVLLSSSINIISILVALIGTVLALINLFNIHNKYKN